MKQYLRSYVNYLQNDWVNWLPMAEFAANNHCSESTGVTPFFAVYGQHPHMGHEPPGATCRLPARQQLDMAAADKFAENMQELTSYLHAEMGLAQAQHAEHADKSRSPAPIFKEGDRVWLDTRNLKMERPSKKLSERYIGPYPIVEVISPTTYRLELPRSMQNHNVFHTNLLRAAATDPLPGQHQASPPRVVIERDRTGKEWMIKNILDSRITKNRQGCTRLEYFVSWKGSPSSWKPQKDLVPGCEAALYEFHVQHPEKPSPSELWRRRSS